MHYLDHASSSPPRPEVVEAMSNWLSGQPPAADPARLHHPGRLARVAIEEAREAVAALLGTRPRQVIFTSGGTEAINAAVWGAARAHQGRPILMAEVEHSAVRQASERLAPIVPIPVDRAGRIVVGALHETLSRYEAEGSPPPALVHCQAANHEVGTIQPIHEVAEVCRRHGVWLHVDACAAAGHVPLALDDLGAELVSVSAHKLGGPPGTGALVVARGLRLDPLLLGGEQERARRAGLENVPGIIGFGAAASALYSSSAGEPSTLLVEASRASRLTASLIEAATSVQGVSLLGDLEQRLPHLVCLSVQGVEAEPVLLGLDAEGIAAHSGSSCSSESLAPSPVLAAMGADAQRSLRLSVGWCSTEADVDAFRQIFPAVMGRLRALRT